ncbi:hypothetical protein Amal_03290 [Acetobacter malorum]|uniref:Uncharacterized protein n=1 Tax=Acetobacter malorum TaxID=178901 RepID=A0A177G5H1_9PROT|nr:hypothetical protein Amal_03290 [Acetobacter malorum]
MLLITHLTGINNSMINPQGFGVPRHQACSSRGLLKSTTGLLALIPNEWKNIL